MELCDSEKQLGSYLDRPYLQLAITIVVVVLLIFLATKAGFALWFLTKLHLQERLVSYGGDGPDFWTIGNQLDEYKTSQIPGMRQDAQAKKEYLTGPARSPAQAISLFDQTKLAALLA